MTNYKYADKCFWGNKWQDMGASGYGCYHISIREKTDDLCLYEPPCEKEDYVCKCFLSKEEVKEMIKSQNFLIENL